MLTSSQTPLTHALTRCEFVPCNNLKATIVAILERSIGMCSLEIDMGMDNHVLLRL